MKRIALVFWTLLFFCWPMGVLHAARKQSPFPAPERIQTSDTTQNRQDSVQAHKPRSIVYQNVDVYIDTDWGDHDVNRDVKCVLEYVDGIGDKLTIYPKSQENKNSSYQRCVIRLRKGVTVKILDHKTKKVLKVLQP